VSDNEVRLTPNIIKVLGDSTRVRILKELSTGPKIPTDISKRLNKSTPTIVEHLEKLSGAGLVEKKEQEGKKYVFYTLTKTGTDLITNRSKLSIVLYGSIIMFLIGISLLGGQLYYNSYSTFSAAAIASSPSTSSSTIASVQNPFAIFFGALAIAILVCAFILLLLYVKKLRRTNVEIGV
jgi:DNA-binding transcriptional ArsR family regulator